MEQTFPLINKLRKGGVACLLAYSVEHDENAKLASITGDVGSSESLVNQKNIDEMAHSIQVAGDLEAQYVASGSPRGKTWVALKLVSRYTHRFRSHRTNPFSVDRALFSKNRRAWSAFQYISIPPGVQRPFLCLIHTLMNLETLRSSRMLNSLHHRTLF